MHPPVLAGRSGGQAREREGPSDFIDPYHLNFQLYPRVKKKKSFSHFINSSTSVNSSWLGKRALTSTLTPFMYIDFVNLINIYFQLVNAGMINANFMTEAKDNPKTIPDFIDSSRRG